MFRFVRIMTFLIWLIKCELIIDKRGEISMSNDYTGIRESRPFTYNDCGGNSTELADKFDKKCF